MEEVKEDGEYVICGQSYCQKKILKSRTQNYYICGCGSIICAPCHSALVRLQNKSGGRLYSNQAFWRVSPYY